MNNGIISLMQRHYNICQIKKDYVPDYDLGYKKPETYRRSYKKIGRNGLCYCGSGLKYKKCCINK